MVRNSNILSKEWKTQEAMLDRPGERRVTNQSLGTDQQY